MLSTIGTGIVIDTAVSLVRSAASTTIISEIKRYHNPCLVQYNNNSISIISDDNFITRLIMSEKLINDITARMKSIPEDQKTSITTCIEQIRNIITSVRNIHDKFLEIVKKHYTEKWFASIRAYDFTNYETGGDYLEAYNKNKLLLDERIRSLKEIMDFFK